MLPNFQACPGPCHRIGPRGQHTYHWPLLFGLCASPLLMAGRSQVISGISKGSENILINNFIITTFDWQGGSQGGGISATVFSLARPGVAPPLNQKWQFRQNNTE